MTDAINVNAELVRELAKLMAESGLTEIEVGQGDSYIRVGKQQQMVANMVAPQLQQAAPAAIAAPAAAAGPAAGTVSSPMVGTVYMSPQPGSPPFISVGSAVKEGDTLLIIEAMKVMNPVKAPKAGTVQQILVDDKHPVEFGEALVVIS